MIQEIRHLGELLGIILPHQFRRAGLHFLTAEDSTQQLGYMMHPKGMVISPHVHNPVPREVHYTMEVLFIKRGRVRIDFYSKSQEYLESRILETGDVILLAMGGHGFEVLEELEMIEVKQGPYAGNLDKTRFNGITSDQARFADQKE